MLPVSSFTHDVEIVVAVERSDHEAAAGDARDCVIEPLYDVDELGVVDRSVVRGEQGAVSQEGVALAARRPPRSGGESADEDMIDVVTGAAGAGAAKRRVRARGCGPATAGARDHHELSTPVRSLNSSIAASHFGTRASRSVQNDCDRRASKSARATPCCSTQVK